MKFPFSDTPFPAAGGLSTWPVLLTLQTALIGVAFGVVDAPVLNPAEGDSLAKFNLTMTSATSGVQIHYTLNGSEPTSSDPSVASGATISIARNSVVKARARTTLGEMSTTTTGIYTLTGDISAGGAHSLGMTSDGTVRSWGQREYGRLGNGVASPATVTTYTTSKYPAGSITDARMVASGLEHSVILKNGGTVWSYGLNDNGRLGDNTNITLGKSEAVQVRNNGTSPASYLINCVAVAAGDTFSGALRNDGKVFTWGSKAGGRLSDSTDILTEPERFYAGVVNMGSNGGGQLININRISFSTGIGMAKEPSDFEKDGEFGYVWMWGENDVGQVGQGTTGVIKRALKVKLNATTFLTDAYDISCAQYHAAVVRWKKDDPYLQGRVYCFGQQRYGRLGNIPWGSTGTVLNADVAVSYPVEVINTEGFPLEGIMSVAAGAAHTLALDLNGNVWAWGENGAGELGNNVTSDRGHAAKVKNPDNTGFLENIVRIAAGGTGANGYSIAVAADGKVYAWGSNANGELGIGSTYSASLPTPVINSSSAQLDLIPNSPPFVSLACLVTPGGYPETVTLRAAPADWDNDVSKVEFFRQGTMVAQLTSPPWETNLNSMSAGTYEVYAVATDATGLTGRSSKTSFTISSSPDGSMDSDGDGLLDATEFAMGLNPNDADSDGDGVPDGVDASPTIPNTVPFIYAGTLMVWTPAE